jgi:hypothetical protein
MGHGHSSPVFEKGVGTANHVFARASHVIGKAAPYAAAATAAATAAYAASDPEVRRKVANGAGAVGFQAFKAIDSIGKES